MEEDPESEWGIQEYSCSKEVETSMMKWILNKGYGIGKKMIITGIAISAAPLVLPPIVVFSAMGVAFSVPSGLAFATYACTNKLMRTLLPTPPSPVLLLQYYSDGDEQEKEKGVELDDDCARVEKGYYMGGYGDDYGREVEFLVSNADGNTDEKGYCYSDEKEGVDVDYELEDVGDEFRQYVGASITNLDENEEEIVQPDDYKEEGEGLIMHLDEIVIERSYYTNENENENENEIEDVVPIEDDVLRRENVVIEEEVIVGKGCYDDVNKEEVHADHYNEGGEALLMNVDEIKYEKKHEIDDEKEREDDVLQRENVTKEDETEQMEDIKQEVETSLGLDVGSVTNFGGGVDEQGYEEDVGEYLQGDDDSLGEENMGEDLSSQMYEIKNNIQEGEKEEVVEESTGLLEESPSNVAFEEVKDFETTEPVIVKKFDSQKLIQNGIKDNECVGELSHVVILAGGHEGNNFNSREVEELDLVAREVVGDSGAHGSKDESDEKVMRESMGTQEKTISDRISNDGAKNVILETTKEKLISSNIDAREISNESAGMNFENLEAGGEVKENAADKNVDVLALPAPGQATLDADNRKVSTKNDTNMPTKEDILDDEKIWEKIGAMRAIVGYKVPSQPTCIEELKALYVFTGVEPPVSFNVDSGLDEVNDKLKFLMSIVGVK